MASTNGAVTPMTKVQQELLAKMTPQTKKVAEACGHISAHVNCGFVMAYYLIGQKVEKALDESQQSIYGADVAKQLAEFIPLIGGDTTKLYNVRMFAKTFDGAFVKEKSEILMNDGSFLTISHWLALTRIEDEKDRNRMLALTFRESLSANELTMRVRSGEVNRRTVRTGGRKPAKPTSLMSGLQRMASVGNQYSNMITAYKESVFDRIDDLDDGSVSEVLLERLREDRAVVERVSTSTAEAKARLDGLIETVTEKLKNKTEATESASADAAESAPSAKPTASTGGSRRKKKIKKAAKKEASRRPAAATV